MTGGKRPHFGGGGRQLLGSVGLAVWIASLVMAIEVVRPGGSADRWLSGMPAEAGPVAGGLRLAVAGAAAHLLVATAGALGGARGRFALRSPARGRWPTPRVVHRLAATAVGTSLVAGVGASPMPAAVATTEVEAPDDAPGSREVAVLTHGGPAEDAIGDTAHGPSGGTGSATGEGAEWLVAPGDHLWRVAERTLEGAWGRPVTDAEVDPYWREVVEANRSRLIEATNPDLVLPGQRLVVPSPPAP